MPPDLTDDDLQGFLDLPAELFGVFDPLSGTAWCSRSVAAVLGYTAEELQHVDLATLVHADDLGAPTEDVEAFPRDGAPLTLDVRCRAKDGSWRWLEWCGSWDERDRVLLGAARDVTARQEAQEAARASERLVEAILDHTSAAIWVKDPEGRFAMVNGAFLRLHGIDREAVIGRTANQLWPDGPMSADETERRVLLGRSPVMTDDVVRVGDVEHVLMTVRFPVFDADGGVASVAAIATDVTERTAEERALSERERVLDTIFRVCPDIVSIIGPDGQVREVSDASARILGYPQDDPSRAPRAALVHPDDQATVEREFGRLLASEQDRVDLRIRVRHRDGHWVTLGTRASALVTEDGRSAGAVVVSRDVSRDLTFEAELHDALTAAERASTAKSTFLSRMSHELRTPLNSILGFAQLLDLEDLQEHQHEAVGHVIRAGHHLLGLINEVLDIARIESGRLDLAVHPTLVALVVADAVDFTRPLADDKEISLVVEGEPAGDGAYVLADRQRLLQVLLNLMSNAVKYNHRQGSVVVRIVPRGLRTEIVVRDTGPGIDPGDMHRVFRPFDRLGAERSGVQGTGMGLTLSKHLVEEMGGEISLESNPGEGTGFTVSLVTAMAPRSTTSTAGAGPRRSTASGGLRVLHIEDNHTNLELVEQILSRVQGLELQAAMTGSLGVELVRENHPDLVLLDLHLPDLSGSDVVARLKADPETSDVPIVVVSADATPTTMRQLHSEGVLAYLTKPIDVPELLHIVESLTAGVSA